VAETPAFARALGRIPSGLFILTTGRGADATGMLASFVQQAGFAPPSVTVALGKDRTIVPALRACGAFCLSILHDASIGFMGHFAKGFDPGEAAFQGIDIAPAANGVPYLTAAHAHLACEIVGEIEWSDHIVFCGEVIDGRRIDDDRPLTHVRKNGLSY
jgi:flavin reductase (DIM6/NTAB) family NADH-FMN oxidoreductase RutF